MIGYKDTVTAQKSTPVRLERRHPYPLFFLVLSFLCAGCTSSSINPNISPPDIASINLLPPQLQAKSVSFEQVLDAYDWLSDKQKVIALKYLLGQNNLSDQHKAEVAYMLARLMQPSVQKQTLPLFDMAQTYAPLTERSLWHKSEIAALLGKEKLVRQSLTALLAQAKDRSSQAATQYSMAQSYIRAGETKNACNLLNQIRTDFPGTDYAIGASYYLGTFSYNQFEQQSRNQHNLLPSIQQLLKDACTCYFEYLQASPDGHFSPDILLKLEHVASCNFWRPTENELVLMATAYSALGQYKSSLSCWQKAGINKHLLAVASCLIALKQFGLAQEKFFKGLINCSADAHCLAIANQLSSHLNRGDCLHFWQQLRHSRFAFQDEALWNIAIRQDPTESLRCYQDLLIRYPQSIHAPEAQWWLLWHKFKSTKINLLPELPGLLFKAAIKYNHCPLTPRFLFWAGKIAEKINDKQHAGFYYQQTLRLHPVTYYGQRANARLKVITNTAPDDYFVTSQTINNIPSNTGETSATSIWNCPPPLKAIDTARRKGEATLYELIHIKQYAEALTENNHLSPEITAWLEGKCGQPWLAINTASQCLEDKSCPIADPALLQQYSFPLLYNRKIVSVCQNTKIVDPLLVHALVREESRYNPNAISSAHALGLCQLMPTTAGSIASNLGVKFTSKDQLFQSDLNLTLGISYLASILRTFDNDRLLSIASYNAGINAVNNFFAGRTKGSLADPDQFVEDFPFRETRDYMRKVFSSYWHYKQIYTY